MLTLIEGELSMQLCLSQSKQSPFLFLFKKNLKLGEGRGEGLELQDIIRDLTQHNNYIHISQHRINFIIFFMKPLSFALYSIDNHTIPTMWVILHMAYGTYESNVCGT